MTSGRSLVRILTFAVLLVGCSPEPIHLSIGTPLSVSETVLYEGVTLGGEDEVTGSFLRSGTVTGDVTVDVEDQAGVIHASATVSAPDSTFDVTFEIPTDATLGPSNWKVVASASGVASGSKTIPLTVGPAAGPIVTWKNCDSAGQMIWAASGNGTRPFVQRSVSNQSFSFAADSAKASLAFTLDYGGGSYKTKVVADLASGLATRGMKSCLTSTSGIPLTGFVANANPGDSSTVSIGPVHVIVPGPAATGGTVPFTFVKVPVGTHTIVASRRMSTGIPSMFYLQRNYVPTQGLSLVIDYLSAFRQTPLSAALSVGNLLGSLVSVASDFWPGGETEAASLACTAPASEPTYPTYGFPPSVVGSMDLHRISAIVKDVANTRSIKLYVNRLANLTATLPNPITVTPSCLTNIAPVRVQLAGTMQTGLTDYLTTRMTQTVGNATRSFSLDFSGAFTGAIPGSPYTQAVPDFSRAGYKGSTWGLLPGVSIKYVHTAIGSNLGGGASWLPPVNGLTVGESSVMVTGQCP